MMRPNQIITNRRRGPRRPASTPRDCAGPAEIVHIAISRANSVARHAAGIQKLKPVDYNLLFNVVPTDPQLATIGRWKPNCRARHRLPRMLVIPSTIMANRS
jgi:pyruvate/2-oxoglutarate dehydrogenase complex dihydrolipoamide dehydrogenase (E3) component